LAWLNAFWKRYHMDPKGSKGGEIFERHRPGLPSAAARTIMPAMPQRRRELQPPGPVPTMRGSVLVTGASGGIGQALSRAFARAGWFVGIHYHRGKQSAETTLHQIKRDGGTGALYEGDIRDAQSVHQLVNAFSRACIPPAGLICAAAVGDDQLLIRLRPEQWDHVVATNLTGTFHCLRAMAPVLLAQGGGTMIVVGSYAGHQGSAGQSAYAASKAGLIGLVKSAALEWGPQNICVNLVLPGWQKTSLSKSAMPTDEGWHDHALRRSPDLEEVVQTVVHLARLKDVSGQIWNCDSRSLAL
jgi:3-oxoacyl-[acyl-carrier protein] reductase